MTPMWKKTEKPFRSVEFNIEGCVDEYTATQSASGGSGVNSSYTALAKVLDEQIVPPADPETVAESVEQFSR